MVAKSRISVLRQGRKLFLLIGLLFFSSVFPALSQTPEPRLKPTFLDLNTTAESFSAHFWDLYMQEEEPEFATWLGIPQSEVRKRKIKTISFKGEGNSFFPPEEVGDFGGHGSPVRKRQEKVRVDSLPPEPTENFKFNYEFDRNGRLTAADQFSPPAKKSIHVRRWYYPNGKLLETRYINNKTVPDLPGAIIRDYSGFLVYYDDSGRKKEQLNYYSYGSSRYKSSDGPHNRSGYYLETRKSLSKTKFDYDPAGQLVATRTYHLPDSGQTGNKYLERLTIYFRDQEGNLLRKIQTQDLQLGAKERRSNVFIKDEVYQYQGLHPFQKIKFEYSFSNAIPDTVKLAKGEIAVDSATLEEPGYYLPDDADELKPVPHLSTLSKPDTSYFLRPGQTRAHFRNYYLRQDEKNRLDLVYDFEHGAQKRFYQDSLAESWTDKGRLGYECRFVWFNQKEQPSREIWIDRYSSDSDQRYFPGDGYPEEVYNTLQRLVMQKRITVLDQKYFYRRIGLPERVELRGSFNKEALRKVGEKNPQPALAETLLRPCRPCEPCEKVKQLIKEQPGWPYRHSSARVFSDFQYKFYK